MAYILQQNGFPAGAAELTDATGSLAAIRILPRTVPVRHGRARWCRRWVASSPTTQRLDLTKSTDPQVTTRDPVSPAEKEALSTASGTNTVELISIYPGADLVGNTVLIKGLFINRPAGMRINVTSTELVHLHCSQ